MNINLNPFPILTTSRLTLRDLRLQDSDELMKLRSNDRVNTYIDRAKPASIEDVKAFINKIHTTLQNQEGVYWVIALSDSNTLIGTICYWDLNIERNTAEIGYELMPDYHGQGIMQEAIEKVIAYGFEEMELTGITAFPREDNISSIKLLERNGFKLNPAGESSDNHEGDIYLRFYLKGDTK